MFGPGAAADAPRWTERLTRALGPIEGDAKRLTAQRAARSGVARERVQALARLEQRLAQAREQAAALFEREALSLLASAADAGEQLADVPGAAAWNAEVQLWLAVTAAQAGLPSLAESAFRRAAALDPSRHLLEAEAPPEVVAQSERVRRQVALGPRGEIEVRVPAEGARVFLDDVVQGQAPLRMRAPVGRHVLRVQAPGYVTYGAFIDVLEGERPVLSVALAEEPVLMHARQLEEAARAGDYTGVTRALDALQDAGADLGRVLVLETAPETTRALLVACEAGGCRAAQRVDDGALSAAWPASALQRDRLARDRAWLAGRAPRVAEEAGPWWQRWYVWAPLVAVAAGATALALTIEPQPEQRLRVTIDSSDVEAP